MLKDNLNLAMQLSGENPHSLALKSGVAQSTIHRISTGATLRPSLDVVSRLARALGVTTAELQDGLKSLDRPAPSERGNIATSPRPVRTFDEGDELEEDEVLVPRLSLALSAGNGRLHWEIDTTGTPNRFRRSWCRTLGVRPESLVTVRVDGDSMAPEIPHGASITIDTSDVTLRSGRRYAIDYQGEFFIKRLFRQPDGALLVRSDNPDKGRYPDWIIPAEHGDAVRILGRPRSIATTLDD